MRARTLLVSIVATVCLAAAAATAGAAPTPDARAGQRLAEQVERGATSCRALDDRELAQLGEFVMERMTGSVDLHRAMDRRMETIWGSAGAARMHTLMGARFAGCATTAGGAGSTMGPGMMAGRGWSRSTAGRVGAAWFGPGMMAVGHDSGWQTRDTVLVILAGTLATALVAVLALRRRS